MRSSWRAFAVGLSLVVILASGLFGHRLLALTDDVRQGLRAYSDLVTVVKQSYGANIQYRELVWASLHGMLRVLDPHSNFLEPEALASMRDRQQASFFGLGLLVGKRQGQLTVISPLEGGPAARLGIRAGDVIDTIDGEPAEPLSVDEAVQKLKGPKGTRVTITILRRGAKEPIPFTVTRAEIPQTTVRFAYMLDAETGYILISDFARATGSEVERALRQLRQRGMRRLIFDLRNNGGGLLDQAIDVADQFLPKGARIVETRGRTGDSRQEYAARGLHETLGMPLVVLVNHGTASASEIVSGAIQDHDVGVVVGQATWGKGLVQTVYNLSYGAGIALTTAKYYTPSGRLIQRDYSSFFDYYYEGLHGEQPAAANGPEYQTDLGRKVYGGGGIAPDVIATQPETSPFTQFLFSRNAFFDFAVDHSQKAAKPATDWRPDTAILADFTAWLEKEGLASKAEVETGLAEPAAQALIMRELEAEILSAAHGLEAGHRVRVRADPVVAVGLEQFAKAAELLAQRQGAKSVAGSR
jgi:carboxyl-terminal processing protease